MRGGAGRALALLALLVLALPTAADPVPEPADYRMDEYLAPVPGSIRGGRTVGDEEAHALWQAGGAVFVDVYPRPEKPANLPAGTLWIDRKRLSIPGAIWLPNVGYGRIPPETDAWFRETLQELTGGDLGRTVVIFCRADCWMSWNAAKRAIEDYGLTSVVWYPDGTDGWEFAGWPMEEIPVAPRD